MPDRFERLFSWITCRNCGGLGWKIKYGYPVTCGGCVGRGKVAAANRSEDGGKE